MKHKKTIMSATFLLLGLGGIHAQEATTATGGEATGAGGTASYSVGQVVYTTATGTNGSIAQGMQQPYEISTTLGINETTINLEMNVYPNPVTNFLTLKVDDVELSTLSFQLIDLKGKVITNKKVNSATTTVAMENLPTATYFLKVTDNNQIVKTFKIIKN
jgi:hypothetical protein